MMKAPCLDCGKPTKGTRCSSCAQNKIAHLESSSTHTPARKASSTARGYDARWRALRAAVLDRDSWRCWVCGCVLDKSNATVDHLVPLAVDRSQRLDAANLRACCRSCNSRKGKRVG